MPVDWLPIANQFLCPVGATGRGSILLRKSRLDTIDLRSKLVLYMHDGMANGITLPNVRAVGNPRCVLPGAADPCYLVQLADKRIDVLQATGARHQWRYNPTDYNAAPGTRDDTSWLDVIIDLWPTPQLGAFPGVPANVPGIADDVVDRVDMTGFRVYDALEDCLAAIGCGLAYDPVADSSAIVYFPGAADHAIAAFARYRGRLMYDESPYAPPSATGPIPASVVVLFPTWYPGRKDREPRRVYGVQFDRPVGIQWAAGSTLVDHIAYIGDFTPVRLFNNGDLTSISSTVIPLRAAQVGRIFYDRFADASPQWPIARAYRGILNDPDVRPGASFDLVGWTVAQKPMTIVLRSGLTAASELYASPAYTGNMDEDTFQTQIILATDVNGVPLRSGGYPPEIDRERDAWGWNGHIANAVSIAGAGLGPLLRRGTALRQGEWASIGTGAKTDQRGRLWRNWEDAGPDEMDRFVVVVDGAKDVTVDGDDFENLTGGPTETVQMYPGQVVRNEWSPGSGLIEEDCYIIGVNSEPLDDGRTYRARATIHEAVDGKRIWVTYCCTGGSDHVWNGGYPGEGGNDSGGHVDGRGPPVVCCGGYRPKNRLFLSMSQSPGLDPSIFCTPSSGNPNPNGTGATIALEYDASVGFWWGAYFLHLYGGPGSCAFPPDVSPPGFVCDKYITVGFHPDCGMSFECSATKSSAALAATVVFWHNIFVGTGAVICPPTGAFNVTPGVDFFAPNDPSHTCFPCCHQCGAPCFCLPMFVGVLTE